MKLLIRPVKEAWISQLWGANPAMYRKYGVPYHNGVDYAAPLGTPILCVADGYLVWQDYDASGYGVYRRIYHPEWDLFSFYAHMLPECLTGEHGLEFRQGDVVGDMGSTGNSTGSHLHFEIRLADGPDKYAPSPVQNMPRGRVDPETIFRMGDRITNARLHHNIGGACEEDEGVEPEIREEADCKREAGGDDHPEMSGPTACRRPED